MGRTGQVSTHHDTGPRASEAPALCNDAQQDPEGTPAQEPPGQRRDIPISGFAQTSGRTYPKGCGQGRLQSLSPLNRTLEPVPSRRQALIASRSQLCHTCTISPHAPLSGASGGEKGTLPPPTGWPLHLLLHATSSVTLPRLRHLFQKCGRSPFKARQRQRTHHFPPSLVAMVCASICSAPLLTRRHYPSPRIICGYFLQPLRFAAPSTKRTLRAITCTSAPHGPLVSPRTAPARGASALRRARVQSALCSDPSPSAGSLHCRLQPLLGLPALHTGLSGCPASRVLSHPTPPWQQQVRATLIPSWRPVLNKSP